jgi:hypothetical protein
MPRVGLLADEIGESVPVSVHADVLPVRPSVEVARAGTRSRSRAYDVRRLEYELLGRPSQNDASWTSLRVRGCSARGEGTSPRRLFVLAVGLAVVGASLSAVGCGSPEGETTAEARPGAELEAAQGLILEGQYAEARAALRELAGRHPDDADVVRQLTELEGLLGVAKPPLARPAHTWLDSIREHVEAAESAWARGDAPAGNLAAEQAVILVDALPFKLEDEALQRRVANVRRVLSSVSDK